MTNLTPIWKTPTQAQALETLVVSRLRIDSLIDQLTEAQMKPKAQLGGGAWSVKDMLGHLAGDEEQAAGLLTGQTPRFNYWAFGSVDEATLLMSIANAIGQSRACERMSPQDDLHSWRRSKAQARSAG